MMNNRRSTRPSSSSTKCKKHPKHQQSPGVCSLCLRERLSKISKSSSRVITYASSSSYSSSASISSISSAASSAALSNTASPMHVYRKGRNLSFLKSKLKKSKSMVFVTERIMEDDVKKKNGFWSKLMHSRTMREMLTTRA
ncbi:hypothetical protein L6452_38609 [Arctium lappa]|uniref:Uncharacterized protein n=1 Tax=Arctium lappa TaxID=4217 RepID=A0ACB8XPZ8_ARCLA|nr:hypothetical protein L6452_38609 [Arctium lappa]